jgi:hypothetical protein
LDEHTRHRVLSGSVLNAGRPAAPGPGEPSWGRVLATTIKVWVSWRAWPACGGRGVRPSKPKFPERESVATERHPYCQKGSS